jgi:hypothetical protein
MIYYVLELKMHVCVLQRICDSLSKLSYLQRINIHCQICVFCSEFVIRSKIELSITNYHSLPKMCVL